MTNAKATSVTPAAPVNASNSNPAQAPNYDAEVDITAEPGAFSWGISALTVQQISLTQYPTPSGLHAEGKVFVDTGLPPNDQFVALYFDATTQYGVDIDFVLSLTPLDSHFQPTGPKKSYELKWTTSKAKPAFLQGPVYLKDLKTPTAKPAAGKSQGPGASPSTPKP